MAIKEAKEIKEAKTVKYKIAGNERIFEERIADASKHLSYLKIDCYDKSGKVIKPKEVAANRLKIDVLKTIKENNTLKLITN